MPVRRQGQKVGLQPPQLDRAKYVGKRHQQRQDGHGGGTTALPDICRLTRTKVINIPQIDQLEEEVWGHSDDHQHPSLISPPGNSSRFFATAAATVANSATPALRSRILRQRRHSAQPNAPPSRAEISSVGGGIRSSVITESRRGAVAGSGVGTGAGAAGASIPFADEEDFTSDDNTSREWNYIIIFIYIFLEGPRFSLYLPCP